MSFNYRNQCLGDLFMSKIMICGLNGSGKSTLGRALAKKLDYVHKDIEEYYFNSGDSYKYSTSLDRESVTKNIESDIEKYDNIIFTSCKGDYGNISDKYDLVIYIKLDKDTRLARVKQRSYDLFGDRILSGGDLFESENKFFEKVYKKDELEIISWVKSLKCDKLEIDGLKSTEENVNFILNYLGE